MPRETWILLLMQILVVGFVGCGRPGGGTAPESFDMEITVEPSERIAKEPVPPTASMPSVPDDRKATSYERVLKNKMIQRALKKADLYHGAIDGIIGPKSKKAIKEFQRSHGLVIDGKVGPKTWSKLKEYL